MMVDGDETDAELDTRKLVLEQNKKKRKSGGFQCMGLGQFVFNGILKKGYKVPTPIQRKCIPVILEGKDVVAMARTGSGKTAAFLIPMFERLRSRSAVNGARALIISPTRELALQTLKFARELGKFTDLRPVAILGGDKMDNQFSAIHENPDIIVATPGRFLHVVVEMDLKLSSVEYVVFDEADRLFEMGFQEQLLEIFKRLPDVRQTLLFSATLPKLLVDFAKAGLNDPVLIRLDVETKLSDNLKLAFISCRTEDKMAIMLHLLKEVISPREMTVVFLATKHHIEYAAMLLEKAGISCTYIYSSLDQLARKDNVTRFQQKKVPVMLVTDLAARGIDIPLLDNVINVNFSSKAKLFVHRVGRVARAGRSGTAYSLVSPDEVAYLLDLHLFLGLPVRYSKPGTKLIDWHGVLGSAPQTIIDELEEELQNFHDGNVDMVNMNRVCKNAYAQYLKSRPAASSESIRRAKDDGKLLKVGIHPLFAGTSGSPMETERSRLLNDMRLYKPQSTIFEVGSTSKVQAAVIMKKVRERNSNAVKNHYDKLQEKQQDNNNLECSGVISQETNMQTALANEEYIEDAFSLVVAPKKRKSGDPFQLKKKKMKMEFKDKEFYIPYQATDHHSEKGLGLEKPTFDQQVHGEVLDLTADDESDMRKHRGQLKWDRKKKKYIQDGGREKKVKKIKTESGVWIPASYKSDLYKQWQKKSKVENDEDDDSSDDDKRNNQSRHAAPQRGRKFRNNTRKGPNDSKFPRRELKTNDEILKNRKVEAKKKFEQNGRRRGGGGGNSGRVKSKMGRGGVGRSGGQRMRGGGGGCGGSRGGRGGGRGRGRGRG